MFYSYRKDELKVRYPESNKNSTIITWHNLYIECLYPQFKVYCDTSKYNAAGKSKTRFEVQRNAR